MLKVRRWSSERRDAGRNTGSSWLRSPARERHEWIERYQMDPTPGRRKNRRRITNWSSDAISYEARAGSTVLRVRDGGRARRPRPSGFLVELFQPHFTLEPAIAVVESDFVWNEKPALPENGMNDGSGGETGTCGSCLLGEQPVHPGFSRQHSRSLRGSAGDGSWSSERER